MESLELDMLKELHKEYKAVAGIDLICISPDRSYIHSEGGSVYSNEVLEKLAEDEQISWLLDQVAEDSIEDIYVDELTDEDGNSCRLATTSTKNNGRIILYWIAIAPIETDYDEFWSKVELLRKVSDQIYYNKATGLSAQLEVLQNKGLEKELENVNDTLEATSALINLLEFDGKSESLFQMWLKAVSEQLGVDSSQIFRRRIGAEGFDIISEFCTPKIASLYENKLNVESNAVFEQWAPIIVSSDNIANAEYEDFAKRGITAFMVFPLIKRADGDGNMLAVFAHTANKHIWTAGEVKYAADASKILQTIIVGRINKNSVADTVETLNEVLNNIGSCVYLENRRTGQIIFNNQMLSDTFTSDWENGILQKIVADNVPANKDHGTVEIFHDGRECWYELVFKKLRWVDGSDATMYSLYDITDRKAYQKKIEQQAYTDFLTGLYNRMCCERDMARMIDEAKRNDTSGGLVYLDLDDFKHINDGLGHQYGDILLKAISNALSSILGIENNCYRMGGDEFVILIPPSQFGRFENILSEIRDVFTRPWFLKDGDYYCTASMGVVTFPDEDETVAALIQKADIAMYEAKKSGKNRMARYNPDEKNSLGKRLDMEKNMRDAQSNNYNEFEVYYQPIIDVENGGVCAGAEALVRWNSVRLGFISPGDFIPLAEYLGLINPIGNHVLVEACKTCKSWNDAGHEHMKVNVNLSVVQLLQSDIVEQVENTLQLTGLDPKNLTLEVTESLAINDMPRMLGILTRIKELGVSIALDDFGTGYSSLNHIREIPFDIIKVDQSFVRDLAEDAYSQSFVKMVAELAETIGVKICVEGIETKEQCKVLSGMKVKYIQGYYYSKPIPKNEFEEKYVK